jgi:hypothetical protein
MNGSLMLAGTLPSGRKTMSEIKERSRTGRMAGRIGASLLLGMLISVISWVAVFNFMTASAVGAGSIVVTVMLGSVWDNFDAVLEGMGGAVAGFFEGIFGDICNCLDS